MASVLTTPVSIGRMTLKNRMVLAPMGVTAGNMTASTVDYFVERAKGGAAMVFCNIKGSVTFEHGEHSIYFNAETEPLFRELVERCHAYGCKVGAQIMPGEGRIGGASTKYKVPISASACPWLHAPKFPCHPLTVEEICQIEADYRESVKAAVRCGADCIEIHAYGGYLTDQFLTARWNQRTDEYGGSMEKRARFLKDLMDICKEEGGKDFPVIVKFTPDHCMDEEGYRKLEEGIELARLIVSYGADALHVDAGCHENWYHAMPPAAMQGMTMQSRSAKAVRSAVDVPVLTQGRFGDIKKAEAALTQGVCDIAVIGRGLLADPELPNKVMTGHPDRIRPCISCNEGCIGRVFSGGAATCAMNPRCGYEDGSKDIPTAKTPKKILVVGAGPGGCMAAIYAKQAGHSVEIWEKSGEVGGSALFVCKPYFKADMYRMIVYFREELARQDIPVRFYTEAVPETVAAYAPEHIIWAAGGKPKAPDDIPGLDSPNVYPAVDALRDCCFVGDRVVIAGGGATAIETALHLDAWGKQVTCVARAFPSKPGFKMNDMLQSEQMAASGVTFLPGTRLHRVEGDALHCKVTVETGEELKVIDCDTVLIALGVEPTMEAAEELRRIAPVTVIGDAANSGKILDAVEGAWDAIRKL